MQKTDLSVDAEVSTGLASVFIYCDQARIGCSCEDPLRAIAVSSFRQCIVGDASAGIPEAEHGSLNFGIVAPAFLASIGIQRQNDVAPGAQVNAIADLNRCALELARDASASLPGTLQFADVVEIDLIDCREARSPLGRSIMAPFTGGVIYLTCTGGTRSAHFIASIGNENGNDEQGIGSDDYLCRALRQQRCRWRLSQTTAHSWHQKPQAEHREEGQSRYQRPRSEPDLEDRP